MRRAEARLSASIINNSSIRCISTGGQVGCITNTSAPRTFSCICTYASPSLKRVTRACPRVRPRKWQTSSHRASFAVPQKTLNLSSTRARCGLGSFFSSVVGFFSAAVFSAVPVSAVAFSAVVATVAIGSVLSSRLSVFSLGAPASLLRTENWQLKTGFLAGPLGFEPRQSAPKALDLPLVDGPVHDRRIALQLSFNHSDSTIENQQSRILFQYCWRVNVLVATAFNPCLSSRLAALAASAGDRNSPYRVDPDPESEAYFAPARSSAPFMSRNSGYSGKTALSKSFPIPVRTRSRSNFSPRLPPFAEAPVLG